MPPQEVRALAERLGAPVATYRRGKGVMDDRHPLAQVLTGGHALWATADVVLAVGTRLQWPTAVWGTDDKLKIIKIDADPDEIERIAKPEIGLVGDAAAVLARLNDHLRHLPPERPDRVAASLAVKQATAQKLAAALAPQLAFCRAIRDALPDNGVLVEELTQVAYASRVLYEARHPRSFITSGYQGTLGWGVATALGVKHALGDVPVVSINGDGGFMFTVQELATAVRHRIPLVTVVFNDAAYGNVRRMQIDVHGNRVIGSDLANPDFVKLGESFGILSLRARGAGGVARRAGKGARRERARADRGAGRRHAVPVAVYRPAAGARQEGVSLSPHAVRETQAVLVEARFRIGCRIPHGDYPFLS